MAIATVQPKWVGKSMTIWGGIIGALTILVPIITQLAGSIGTTVPVDPTDVTSIGDAVGTTIKAIGGVATLVMVFWGRIRAGRVAQPVSMVPNAPAVTVVLPTSTAGKRSG